MLRPTLWMICIIEQWQYYLYQKTVKNNQSLNANETKGDEFFINISKDPILIDGIVNIFHRLIRVEELRELSKFKDT